MKKWLFSLAIGIVSGIIAFLLYPTDIGLSIFITISIIILTRVALSKNNGDGGNVNNMVNF
jgi:uncharacterized membrane protein YjjP (DUF1212 family)